MDLRCFVRGPDKVTLRFFSNLKNSNEFFLSSHLQACK